MIPTEFLLYLTNFIIPQNPMLLMAEGDDLPTDFCSGTSFAVSCVEYGYQEAYLILDHLSSLNTKGKKIFFLTCILKVRAFYNASWTKLWARHTKQNIYYDIDNLKIYKMTFRCIPAQVSHRDLLNRS